VPSHALLYCQPHACQKSSFGVRSCAELARCATGSFTRFSAVLCNIVFFLTILLPRFAPAVVVILALFGTLCGQKFGIMRPARLARPHMQRQAVVVDVQTAPANGKRLRMNAVDFLLALGTGHNGAFMISVIGSTIPSSLHRRTASAAYCRSRNSSRHFLSRSASRWSCRARRFASPSGL
jgi:hypothetical protein